MRLNIGVEGLEEAQAVLVGFSDRRLAAVGATALTRAANVIAQAQRQEISRAFDRPTPYTMGSVGMTPATAETLWAEVFVRDRQSGSSGRPAAVYLQAEVFGGQRRLKAVERLLQRSGLMPAGWFLVPGAGARLDAFGNLERSQLTQILTQLRRSRQAGPQPRRRLVGAQRQAGGQFFAIQPGKPGAAPGIYAREFAGRNIAPVLIFVRTSVYPIRYRFADLARQVAERQVLAQFEVAFAESAARWASIVRQSRRVDFGLFGLLAGLH